MSAASVEARAARVRALSDASAACPCRPVAPGKRAAKASGGIRASSAPRTSPFCANGSAATAGCTAASSVDPRLGCNPRPAPRLAPGARAEYTCAPNDCFCTTCPDDRRHRCLNGKGRPSRRPQHRDHRARRSWQDDAGRRLLATGGTVPHRRGRRRLRDGLERSRARARHHHPLQVHRHHLEGDAHQHRRYAGPRRLRRRGRARAEDGRLRLPAGRRLRGADAPDPLRHPQSAGAGPAAHLGREQDRSRRLRSGRGRRRHLRSVLCAGRHRRAARLPDRLRLRPRGLGGQEPDRPARRSGAAPRSGGRLCPAAHRRRGRPLLHAGDHPRLRRLPGLRRHRAGRLRSDQARRACPLRAPQRQPRGVPGGQAARLPVAQALRAGRGRRRRHLRHHRDGRSDRRRDDHRDRPPHHLAAARDRRADGEDAVHVEQRPLRRARGEVRHLAQPARPACSKR